MKNKPKRRKDKYNPYTIISSNDEKIFFVKFKDVEANIHYIQVSKEIYETFNYFELEDISFMNKYDRHIEHNKYKKNVWEKRIIKDSIILENNIIEKEKNEKLYQAIFKLPKKQQRRIVLYYFCDLTQKEIAKKERCSIRAIQYSLEAALKNLKNFLK